MSPTRRYLRISKASVIECRIYLDNPALANTWLLNPRNPVLPNIIQRIKPLVLPKLREERERQKGKGKKSKAIRDVVVEDDFEVSIFFQNRQSTSHSLLVKQKTFEEPDKKRLKSNAGSKLTRASSNDDGGVVDVDVESPGPVILQEEDEDGEGRGISLSDIPEAPTEDGTRSKRKKGHHGASESVADLNSEQDLASEDESHDGGDEKKKLGFRTSYTGFRIHGLTLCMVVHRRGPSQGSSESRGKGSSGNGVGRSMMESWITAGSEADENAID